MHAEQHVRSACMLVHINTRLCNKKSGRVSKWWEDYITKQKAGEKSLRYTLPLMRPKGADTGLSNAVLLEIQTKAGNTEKWRFFLREIAERRSPLRYWPPERDMELRQVKGWAGDHVALVKATLCGPSTLKW